MLKIVADENMPLLERLFGDFAEIRRLPGRDMKQSDLVDADVLLVRSISQVNQALLEGTKVKFVGTATIGTDHIDKDYLSAQNIAFADAAGCNAQAVAEYVLCAIAYWAEKRNINLDNACVGIIGAGNVGTQLSQLLAHVGIKYLLNDPLLEEQGDKRKFVDIDAINQCEIVSCHVPLTKGTHHPTKHLINKDFLQKLASNSLLINSSRGAVLDNLAALKFCQNSENAANVDLVLDVWEQEPDINLELLEHCLLGTSHIAGYSLEGKIRGTYILYQALQRWLESKETIALESLLAKRRKWTKPNSLNQLQQSLTEFYDIKADDRKLRAVKKTMKTSFDKLRKNYQTRYEFWK